MFNCILSLRKLFFTLVLFLLFAGCNGKSEVIKDGEETEIQGEIPCCMEEMLPETMYDTITDDISSDLSAYEDEQENDSITEFLIDFDSSDIADERDFSESYDGEIICSPPLIYHPGFGTCVSTEGIGENCSNETGCRQGQDCVEYTGFGGIVFHECYIPCGPRPDRLCPEGFWCMDAMDGPQNVCMPLDSP